MKQPKQNKQMKKRLILKFTVLIFAGISSLKAQSFSEEDLVLQAGIGLGTTFGTYGTGFGLPLGAGVEYGIKDLEKGAIGIGGDFGFVSASGVTVTSFGARGSYYLTELFEIDNEDLDIYTGLGLYYRNFNVSGSPYNWGSGVYPAFHAGARYYFSDNIGGFAELGNNWGWLNVGVAFKL